MRTALMAVLPDALPGITPAAAQAAVAEGLKKA
jgi:hypothetical protein